MVLHGDREPESVGMNLSICWRSSDFLAELLLTMVPLKWYGQCLAKKVLSVKYLVICEIGDF